MNKKPVSVVLPFYNAEKTLSAAIKSILNQTHLNFELILVNNNSSDSSQSVAESFDDSRIKIVHEPKKGVVYALNTGCDLASGEFIARMDADDVAHPQRLEKQVKFLMENSGYGLVAAGATYISTLDNSEGFKRYVKWSNNVRTYEEILNSRFIESPLIHPTVMWKKDVGKLFGLYKDGDFPEDYELWLRWLDVGVKMYKLPECLHKWHDHKERLTRTNKNYTDDAFSIIKSKYLAKWLQKHNHYHPWIYVWGASKISRNRLKFLLSHGVRVKAYIDIKTSRQLDSPVIDYQNLPSPKKAFVLVYMKHEKIRKKIKEFLLVKNFKEGKEFLLVS